jgi:hypothetical protein
MSPIVSLDFSHFVRHFSLSLRLLFGCSSTGHGSYNRSTLRLVPFDSSNGGARQPPQREDHSGIVGTRKIYALRKLQANRMVISEQKSLDRKMVQYCEIDSTTIVRSATAFLCNS